MERHNGYQTRLRNDWINDMDRPWYNDPNVIRYQKNKMLRKQRKFNDYLEHMGHVVLNTTEYSKEELFQKIIKFVIIIVFIYLLISWIRRDSRQQNRIQELESVAPNTGQTTSGGMMLPQGFGYPQYMNMMCGGGSGMSCMNCGHKFMLQGLRTIPQYYG